jgi:hypothetical protein
MEVPYPVYDFSLCECCRWQGDADCLPPDNGEKCKRFEAIPDDLTEAVPSV